MLSSPSAAGATSTSCGHGLAGSSATSDAVLEARFGPLLDLARRVCIQATFDCGYCPAR